MYGFLDMLSLTRFTICLSEPTLKSVLLRLLTRRDDTGPHLSVARARSILVTRRLVRLR